MVAVTSSSDKMGDSDEQRRMDALNELREKFPRCSHEELVELLNARDSNAEHLSPDGGACQSATPSQAARGEAANGQPLHGGVAEGLQDDSESGLLGTDYDTNYRVYYHMIKGKLVPCFPLSEDDGYLLKALGVALDARGEGEPEQRERLKQLGDRVLLAKHS